MLTAYEPIGQGIGFLLSGCAGAIGFLVWVGYWWLHKFRAPVPVTRFGKGVLWCMVGLVAVVVVLFPPLRNVGDWRDQSSGQPVSAVEADQLNRFCFGWVPTFAWVGLVGVEEPMTPGVRVGLDVLGVSAHCDRTRWTVDWIAFAAEVGCLTLVVLPFARARHPTTAARRVQAKRLP